MKELDRVKERYDFSFDARQLGLVLLAVAAIAAVVFALGVSVGVQWERKKSGATDRVAVSASGHHAPKAQASSAPAVPAAPPVLAPVTTNAKAAPDKTQNSPSETRAVSLTFPKVLTSNTKNTAPLKAEKKTDDKRTEAKKTEEKRAEDSKAESRSRKYTVQVGAYNEKGAAKARVDKLRKKGYDARVYDAGGRKYEYKVRVGSFGTRAEAAQAAKKLSGAEKVTPYITLEEM